MRGLPEPGRRRWNKEAAGLARGAGGAAPSAGGCPAVLLSSCPAVLLSGCPAVQLSGCPAVRLSGCLAVLLSCCLALQPQLALLLYSEGWNTGQENPSEAIVYLALSRTFVTQVHLCPQPAGHACPTPGEGASSLGPLLSATRAANGAVSSGTRPSRAGEAAPGARVTGVSGAGASGRCRPDHVTGSGRGPAHCRHSARWRFPNARRHLR